MRGDERTAGERHAGRGHLRFALRWLNYRIHLVQYGFTQLIERRPWIALPIAVILLGPVWTLYCLAYPVLALLALAEMWIERRLTNASPSPAHAENVGPTPSPHD